MTEVRLASSLSLLNYLLPPLALALMLSNKDPGLSAALQRPTLRVTRAPRSTGMSLLGTRDYGLKSTLASAYSLGSVLCAQSLHALAALATAVKWRRLPTEDLATPLVAVTKVY